MAIRIHAHHHGSGTAGSPAGFPMPHVNPQIWVSPLGLNPMPATDADPDLAAARVAPFLLAAAPGNRVLFFWHDFENQDDAREDLPQFVADGITNFTDLTSWYTDFFAALHTAGAVVDRLVFDYEDGVSYWNTLGVITDVEAREDAIAAVFADEAALRNMSSEMRTFPEEDYLAFNSSSGAIDAWNRWAAKELADALRPIVYDIPLAQLGYAPPVTNYADLSPSFPVLDHQGYDLYPCIIHNEASPVCYFWGFGARYAETTKGVAWNQLIDHCNVIRSGNANTRVIPWVSYPSYDFLAPNYYNAAQRPFWREMIRHFVHSGVREFLYWNGYTDAADDAYADEVFAELQEDLIPRTASSVVISSGVSVATLRADSSSSRRIAISENLPEVELDVDSITTNGYTTSYSDFS